MEESEEDQELPPEVCVRERWTGDVIFSVKEEWFLWLLREPCRSWGKSGSFELRVAVPMPGLSTLD